MASVVIWMRGTDDWTRDGHGTERGNQKWFQRKKVKVKSFSCVRPFANPWTVDHEAPLSMGFSRQETWSGLPFPSLVIKYEVSEMSEVKLLSRVRLFATHGL